MELAIKATLDEFGVRRVADASGIPFWTLRKWRDKDRIPGEGAQREMRMQRLAEAVEKLKAEDANRGQAA